MSDSRHVSQKLKISEMKLAIPMSDISRHYKLSLTDCVMSEKSFVVHIKIPLVQKISTGIQSGSCWSCCRLHLGKITTREYWCIKNNLGSKRKEKTLTCSNLRQCKPYDDRICYLSRFISDALFEPQCALKLYNGLTVEDLYQHDQLWCRTSRETVISEIKANKYMIP